VTIEDHLRQLVWSQRATEPPNPWKYHSVADFVIKHGRNWLPGPLPKRFTRGKQNLCFENAAKLTLAHSDLVYVEGYVYQPVEPILHAWCVDKLGIVIDNTLTSPERCKYFGVAFKTDYLKKVRASGEGYSGLLDTWYLKEHPYALLTGADTTEEALL
jgi:hypothetical protein